MKSIYIRPTNIIFGQKASYFIQEKSAKSLCGLENVYPKRLSGKEEASTTKKKLGSALGAIGLKPNTQS